MSINPIEENSTPKPTGSLEDLFRHHLGEEAAVPPRPVVWDQVDNSLLVRQNETYRRRLAATRWVAAASLLLATLAGAGWWSLRDARLGGTDLATSRSATNSGATPGATAAAGSPRREGAVGAAEEAAAPASEATASGPLNNAGSAVGSAFSAPGAATAAASAGRGAGAGTATGREIGTSIPRVPGAASAHAANIAQSSSGFGGTRVGDAVRPAFSATGAGAAFAAARLGTAGGGLTGSGTAPTEALVPTSAAAAEQVDLLATRPATLGLTNPAALPNGLATVPVPAGAAPAVATEAHRWRYGARYTVGTFNPNINFSRAGIEPEYDYNPALGAGSPALTEAAAAQYRQNLRPGLSQRLALLATRHLGGHWSLSTGVELSQATAKSASASAFVGEQLLDLGQTNSGPLRTTDFRYRLVSIPVEVRYANPVKRGWSLYGRLGGAVSALLGVRSEVEGSPESTRTYSIAGAAGPYRRVLGSVRGGAGAQFRPGTAHWTLTLGPVAELGLVPLNAHPAQSYLAQSRPYSFGVEAAVEFGR